MLLQKDTISLHSVSKKYGAIEAVRGVSFTVKAGTITGLIGPNGAGKTTIIRMIGTLLKPDKGDILVDGINNISEPEETRKRIGLLPENPGFYKKLSVYENIQFFSSFYEIPDVKKQIIKHIEMFDLKEKTDSLAGELSKGMKAKLSLIKALIHDPVAVILDEPFNGLDPDSRISLKKTLVELRNKGKGILLSSHELFEVETLCDRVVLVDQGRVLADESIQKLKERFSDNGVPTLENIYSSLRQSAKN